MAVFEIDLEKALGDGEEARGFYCTDEGYFLHEEQFAVEEVDTDFTPCANCGEPGTLIAVSVVQRQPEESSGTS